MSMFNDISYGSKDNEKECLANAKLVSLHARRLGAGQWSSIGPGSEKKWYCISEDSPQGVWDKMAEKMMLTFAESGHPVFRATCWNSQKVIVQFSAVRAHCPEDDSKAKDMENCVYTMQPIWKRLKLFFPIIVSANQLSLYGAVAESVKSTKPFTIDQGDLIW